MKCKAHFYLLNEHFSIEHAEANHNGEESESNIKHEWEDELEITSPITKVNVLEKASYFLEGVLPSEEAFKEEVKEMRIFELVSEKGNTLLGCSESIMDSYELNEKDGNFILNVYIKANEPMSNPISGVYIGSKDFPKALIF